MDQLPELKAGDPLPGASWFNMARRLLHRALRVNVDDSSGLTCTQGTDGTVIGVGFSVGGFGFAIVKTSSTITARSSGVPGTGTAKLQTWNGTTLADGTEIPISNISGKVGGISSGKYGFAVELWWLWWIVVTEC